MPAEDGLAAEVHGMHGGDFKVPVNVMLVDSRREAARVVIGEPGSIATVRQ